MRIAILILLFSVIGFQTQTIAQAQQFSDKNTLFVNAGLLVLAGGLNINYERLLYQAEEQRFIRSLGVRVGGGYWANWGSSGSHLITGISAMTGKSKHHAEGTLGTALLYDKLSYDIAVSNATYFEAVLPTKLDHTQLLPVLAVGYRYQKPKGGFVFRTGVGFPEGLYLGLGFNF